MNDGKKTIKIKIPGTDGFDRSPHFRGQAQDAEESIEMRRLAIFFFSMVGSTIFIYWMRNRKRLAIQVQQRDL